jgi:hypothetical protein
MTMYCGDNEAPDAFPLRAILAGVIGAVVPLGVAVAVDKLLMKHTRESPELTFVESRLWGYWDLILEEAVLSGSTSDLDTQRSICMKALDAPEVPSKVGKQLLDCLSTLCSLQSLVCGKDRSGFVPGEICSSLMELRSRRISVKTNFSSSLDKLKSQTRDAMDTGPRSVSALRVYLMVPLIESFLQSVSEARKISSEKPEFSLKIYIVNSFKFLRFSWTKLAEAIRFSLVMVALGELLVYWDATDETVDTYALWAFVPTLLLAERVECVGQAIREGLIYTLSGLVGSGLGILCLLLNGGGHSSFIAELALIGVLGLAIQASKPRWGDAGLVVIVSWMICVLGNFGLDPSDDASNNNDTVGGLNILWRVALYRSAITCFSVLFMAICFVIIPTNFAVKNLDSLSLKFASKMAYYICDRMAVCNGNEETETAYKEDGATSRSNDSSELWSMHAFATAVYPAKRRFAKAECLAPKFSLLDTKVVEEIWGNFLSLPKVLHPLVISTTSKPVLGLQEAIRGVARELESLSSEDGLRDAERSLIKPRARQLREAFSAAKRWLLTGEHTTDQLESEGIVSTYILGICLSDFLKKWVIVERHFGLHEEFEIPTALRDNTDDELDVDV